MFPQSSTQSCSHCRIRRLPVFAVVALLAVSTSQALAQDQEKKPVNPIDFDRITVKKDQDQLGNQSRRKT